MVEQTIWWIPFDEHWKENNINSKVFRKKVWTFAFLSVRMEQLKIHNSRENRGLI